MRVRDKRKPQKEQKAHKTIDKHKTTNVEAKPATPNKTTTATAAAATATAQLPPTLPATEKVAFDNRIKRKNVLALNEKVAALREYDRQPVYKHVGRMFNCSPDQIKRIVQQKEEILRAWEQRTRRNRDAKTQELKVVRVSMLGRAVFTWIRRMMYYKDFIISDGLIQKMALQFKSSMGLSNFFPHQEWCDKFRTTYNIKHSDTKLLNIGFNVSHSVQINDIANFVMSECAGALEPLEGDEDLSPAPVSHSSSHFDEDDGDIEGDVDVDGGGDVSDPEEDQPPDIKPSISELQLQTLPQMVRLPQVAPGTTQKVLLATPILPPGATSGGAQTMTIIPLGTLAQSITQRPATQPSAPPKATMPPPMLNIKQEIKTEPTDPDAEEQRVEELLPKEQQKQPEVQEEEDAAVRIKEELESEGEMLDGDDEHDLNGVDDDDDANGGRSSVTSLAEILAANVDDEKQYIEQTRALRLRKRSHSPAGDLPTAMTILPPMPTLTKAPAVAAAAKRQRQHDDNNNAGSGQQEIISCAKARKYLKLVEELAMAKKSYRLIELMTRADEVLRELADE